MASEVRLAFIWHMHQPDYRDPATGVHLLPWVRLHSMRGYTDLAMVSEEFRHFHQNINFSGVLLGQIAELARNLDLDHFYQLSQKPTEELIESEKDFLLRHCFLVNWQVHVKPHPRYNQLLMKRGYEVTGIDLEYVRGRFTKSDFRDLVVLFNLAWCGFSVRSDPVIAGLIAKERGYTEEEKLLLLEKNREILEQVIPRHGRLAAKGIIEISCTPENHPILPLLIDSRVRPDSHPDTPVFRHPEDARRQIRLAMDRVERTFGIRPRGMWPAEGSVSQAAVEMIQDEDIKWIAADEALLTNKSTGTEVPPAAEIWRPWLVGRADGPPLACFFRNRGLSDDIGFNFANLAPAKAVEQFVGHLEDISSSIKRTGPPLLVTIVCDGENPWEYFPDGGRGFLKGLAQKLEKHPRIKLTTPSEYLQEFPVESRVKKIGAGSWINANFDIWMGSPEDRRAWEYLAEVRDLLDKEHPLPPESKDEIGTEERLKVLEQLWVAEGSDWFWWYGEPFDSPLDYMFDIIFRRRLRRAYELLGKETPAELLVPVDPKLPIDNLSVQAPLDIINPVIDGRITTFYEWSGAGHLKASLLEGLVARAKPGPITDVYFGADRANLFIRLDINREELQPDDALVIRVLKPLEISIAVDLKPAPKAVMRLYRPVDGSTDYHIETLDSAAVDKIVELSVPTKSIGMTPKSIVSFVCFLMRGMHQFDRCPLLGTVSIEMPDEHYLGELWRE
jgi:alpha-amylase/alpha-mannosidase (GH57 family)